jgi:hypothetical protein
MCLRNDQRAWLTAVRNRCTTRACLHDAYLKRLGALADLQPGMDPVKSQDLPETPRLRLFVPPVDRHEANVVSGAAHYEGRGTIDYVMNKGGFVLAEKNGTQHAIISDMAIQPETYTQLDRLKTEKQAVVVGGQHGRLDKTLLGFDNRSCIAVYAVR